MPGCRRALRWLGSQLLYRRSQGDCPEPMRTSQRNLHHQLLRSGVLITRSSHAGMLCEIGTVVSSQTDEEFIAGCCARATSGHAAAPPSSVMNASRRLMRCPPQTGGHTLPHRYAKTLLLHHSKIDRRMAEMGQTRPFGDVCSMSALPPKAAVRTSVDVSNVPTAVIGRPAAPRFAEW
jgi:hypothetical protein